MRLKSWAMWKKERNYDPGKNGYWVRPSVVTTRFAWVCNFCNGVGEVTYRGETYYCYCSMARWGNEVKKRLVDVRSRALPARLKDIKYDHLTDLNHKDALSDAVEKTRVWSTLPRGYLMLTGKYGTGKSHLLRWLNGDWWPIALYLTAPDFNRLVHMYRRNDELDELVDTVAKAPILLFDDLGMEYGGKLTQDMFAHVIDSRDRDVDSFPTAIASNLTRSIIKNIPRVGSRIYNQDHLTEVILAITDYRLRDSVGT